MKGWISLGLRELWKYRELVYFLTWRDVKVRYKQTLLGASWAVIQPLFMVLVFSLFFNKLQDPTVGVPNYLVTFAALVPWTFFANGLTQASTSVVGSANLVRKVYFPRLAIPLASILSGVIDFVIAFGILLGLMGFKGVWPGVHVLFLPLFVLLAVITSLGVGLWLAALNVRFRDVRYVIPFLTQFWLFASPIAYPSSRILKDYGQTWYTVYGLNPMTGVVEGFKWALLGVGEAPGPMVYLSAATALVVLVTGAYYFRRMERHFADLI
ncbi:MAG TPA: phosphate ABC transporter permease [Verrucomicrobiales bacterium]|nr:phosphate ABC transporter permease [Verrucomicrobiales bacterium]